MRFLIDLIEVVILTIINFFMMPIVICLAIIALGYVARLTDLF